MSNSSEHDPLDMFGAPREGWSGNLVDGAIQRWTGMNPDETKKLAADAKALMEKAKTNLDTIHWLLTPVRLIRSFFITTKT